MFEAPTIHTREDKILDRVMDRWRTKYPQEVQDYLKEIKFLRETTKRSNGAVDGGWGHLKASLPTRPFILMEKLVPGFWQDGGTDKFLRRFSELRITPPK